ncbi:hypothetical protein CALVIDRAFT_531797 [Calocera viscosa TUFC12733]|uniref:Uncharacterized protein n=1 Tax=Calocera viscosa (strain TUFC12733) TaxID=1330018 RepID=A0A167FUQ4_CALVF|nr:hypothetical protein CALVIDRAFT_531797 [Calocera viscosa TUFC12733]
MWKFAYSLMEKGPVFWEGKVFTTALKNDLVDSLEKSEWDEVVIVFGVGGCGMSFHEGAFAEAGAMQLKLIIKGSHSIKTIAYEVLESTSTASEKIEASNYHQPVDLGLGQVRYILGMLRSKSGESGGVIAFKARCGELNISICSGVMSVNLSIPLEETWKFVFLDARCSTDEFSLTTPSIHLRSPSK